MTSGPRNDTFETIACETVGHVAHLTLNRPERRNAVSRLMLDEIVSALDRLAADDGRPCHRPCRCGPVLLRRDST